MICRTANAEILALECHCTAIHCITAGCIKSSAHFNDAVCAAIKNDISQFILAERFSFNRARVVHYGVQYRTGITCCHEHIAAIRTDLACVQDTGIRYGFIDLEIDFTIALIIDADVVAGCQSYRTARGCDCTIVLNLIGQQCYDSALILHLLCGNCTIVDNRGF